MDAKERIMAVFNHELPDRVPIMELSMDSKIIAQHYGGDYGSVVEMGKLKWLQKLPGWRYIMKGTMSNPKTYIKMVVDNVKLYRKILVQFSKSYSNLISDFNGLFEKNDITKVETLAHTVKSAAGYVGAEKLNKLLISIGFLIYAFIPLSRIF